MSATPYQVMPPLAPDEFAALKADILARGVQVPVEYDEMGNILDGHHRVQACFELGITHWPRLVRHGMNEPEKRRHARRLNLDRRHLTAELKRILIADELKEDPISSDRAIGHGLGIDHKTVAVVRGKLEVAGEIPRLAERVGRDNRVRRITQFIPSTPEEKKGLQLSAKALNAENDQQQRQARRDIASDLSDARVALTGQRQYPCVYADPAWRRKAGIGDRAYENHYPTMTWDEIMSLPVGDLMLPNAWLFLWLPRAHLMALHKTLIEVQSPDGELLETWIKMPLAWAIARAWGCDEYSTCFIWTKTDEEHENDIGTGLVVRDQDEVLCLFKRGNGLPKPAGNEKFGSNHRERSRPLGHSRKPQFYREMIATMVGTDSDGNALPVLELFARADEQFPLPANWDTWGNQAQVKEGEAA